MRKVLDTLRLTFELQRSQREVAQTLHLSQGCVSGYLARFAASGLPWPLPGDLGEAELDGHLFKRPAIAASATRPVPDWATVHSELKTKGVTLQLLWIEYKRQHADGYSIRNSARATPPGRGTIEPALRQVYVAGERTFVDYAGPTVSIVNPKTGEVREAQIFVGALGASHLLYCVATWTQTLPDWISAHVRMLEYFDGATALTIPDNAAALVRHPCYYESEINPTYREFAAHYSTVILPAHRVLPTPFDNQALRFRAWPFGGAPAILPFGRFFHLTRHCWRH